MPVTYKYKKRDGNIRNIVCDETKIKKFNFSNNSEDTHALVWDLENKGWRTLILDNIIFDADQEHVAGDSKTESFDSDSFDPHKFDVYEILGNCEVDDFVKFTVKGILVGVVLSCLLNSFTFATHYYTNLFDEKIL